MIKGRKAKVERKKEKVEIGTNPIHVIINSRIKNVFETNSNGLLYFLL